MTHLCPCLYILGAMSSTFCWHSNDLSDISGALRIIILLQILKQESILNIFYK